MDLSHEDVQEILKIIDASSLEELHLEIGDFKLIVRKRGAGRAGGPERRNRDAPSDMPVPVWLEGGAESVAAAAAERGRPAAPGPSRPGGVEVKAPMVGTFYRAPAPGAPPFVEVGSTVTEDQTVCIIEVMKLMNSIKAGCRGRVVEICAENAALVEFGQVLMVIEPLP